MQRAAPAPLLPSEVDEALGFALYSVEEELWRRIRTCEGVLRAIARCGYSLISTRMDILSLCYAESMRAQMGYTVLWVVASEHVCFGGRLQLHVGLEADRSPHVQLPHRSAGARMLAGLP